MVDKNELYYVSAEGLDEDLLISKTTYQTISSSIEKGFKLVIVESQHNPNKRYRIPVKKINYLLAQGM